MVSLFLGFMKIWIVVPVHNEGEIFQRWLPSLLQVASLLKAKVVVVDDGSSSKFQVASSKFQDLQLATCNFLRHEVNCGAGAAVTTGMEYAKQHGADIVLTIDGDGQHDPRDLIELAEKLKSGETDIINGSRFLKRQSIPFFRRIANFLANIITFLLSGFWLTDSQSGMKGFSKKALEKIQIQTPGYEWCTDVFREANQYDFRVKEAPISVSYNAYSLKKGQSFAIGLDMMMRLIVRSLMK